MSATDIRQALDTALGYVKEAGDILERAGLGNNALSRAEEELRLALKGTWRGLIAAYQSRAPRPTRASSGDREGDGTWVIGYGSNATAPDVTRTASAHSPSTSTAASLTMSCGFWTRW